MKQFETMNEDSTKKQRGYIYGLCKKLGIDGHDLPSEISDISDPLSMTQEEAGKVIEILLLMEDGNEAAYCKVAVDYDLIDLVGKTVILTARDMPYSFEYGTIVKLDLKAGLMTFGERVGCGADIDRDYPLSLLGDETLRISSTEKSEGEIQAELLGETSQVEIIKTADWLSAELDNYDIRVSYTLESNSFESLSEALDYREVTNIRDGIAYRAKSRKIALTSAQLEFIAEEIKNARK